MKPALLWLLLLAACGGEPSGRVPRAPLAGEDCLLIVLDALHADHLGCYGETRPTSPVLDGLAARGVRFSRVWSQTSWTLSSTVSLFTSQYQETHGVQEKMSALGPGAFTMAEAFAAAGYETLLFTENPFCSDEFGLDQGFEQVHRRFFRADGAQATEGARIWRMGDGDGLVDDILTTLAAERGRPRFVYAHFRRPHAPYDPPAEVAARFVDPAYAGPVTGSTAEVRAGAQRLSAADLTRMRDLYQAGLSVADQQLGRLLAGIDRSRTLLLITSDHGDAFGQHGRLGHNFSSYEEMVHVPLIVAHPRLPGGRVLDAPAMSIDLLPTLAELFGLAVPEGRMQGRSLAAELQGGAEPATALVFSSSRRAENQMFAGSDGRWKYVRVPDRRREMLFDLASDPGEKRNLATARPRQLARWRERLNAWLAAQTPGGDGVPSELDEETLRSLRGLGYLGGEDRR